MKNEFIKWDVVDEHLNEADFLLWRWRNAIFSPSFTIESLRHSVELRLFSNLDGLCIGGETVAKKLLEPLLEEAASPELATVAALVMLDSNKEETRCRVLDAMVSSSGSLQEAIALAFQLSTSPYLDSDLSSRIWKEPSREQALLLRIKTARGLSIEPIPRSFFEDETTTLSALHSIKFSKYSADQYDMLIETLATSGDALQRAMAVEAGLARHSQRIWNICFDFISTDDPSLSRYMLLVALLGNSPSHRGLFERLSDETCREALLQALGYTGTIESVNHCVPFLRSDNQREAKLAAESISLITGIDLSDDRFILEEASSVDEVEDTEEMPETTEQSETDHAGVRLIIVPVEDENSVTNKQLEETFEADAVDELPLPNPSAIEEWIATHLTEFADGQRYLLGKKWSVRTHVEALESTSMWRRHPLALKLLIESGGEDVVSTWAFSVCQRRQLAALSGLKNSDIGDRSRFWI